MSSAGTVVWSRQLGSYLAPLYGNWAALMPHTSLLVSARLHSLIEPTNIQNTTVFPLMLEFVENYQTVCQIYAVMDYDSFKETPWRVLFI